MEKAEDFEKYTHRINLLSKSTSEEFCLKKGEYTLLFEYSGKITEKDSGFYACVDPRFTKKHFQQPQ